MLNKQGWPRKTTTYRGMDDKPLRLPFFIFHIFPKTSTYVKIDSCHLTYPGRCIQWNRNSWSVKRIISKKNKIFSMKEGRIMEASSEPGLM